jgi:hypothetical protein
MQLRRFAGVLAIIVFSLGSFSIAAFAQGSSATLTGRVTDSAGLVVVGAHVQAINVNTNAIFPAETNESGLYSIPALLPGEYRILVDQEGFERIVKPGVELHVADIVALNFSLQVGSTTQTVTVEGGAPLVETSSSALGGLVNEQKMSDLPLIGRNYVDLSLMQSGVALNKNAGTLAGLGGTIYSSNGAPTISNNFLLDGTSVVNASGWGSASSSGSTLGVDGIKEFKVITSVFSAEYGMTMGSQMVMVSKGGTNQFHGDVFDYLRNSALDAPNYFDTGKIPLFQRNNFGGAFGGPIRKDKTFVFGVYEGLRLNVGFSGFDNVPAAGCHGAAGTLILKANCPALSADTVVSAITAPLLTLYPNPTDNVANTYSFGSNSIQGENYGQIRVDHNFSSADTLFVRYTVDDGDENTANTTINASTITGGVAFPQFRFAAVSRNQFLTLTETHVLSTSLLNTARLSFSRTNFSSGNKYDTQALAGIPPLVAGQPFGAFSITGFSMVGGNGVIGPPDAFHLQNIYSLADDVFYTRGTHSLKFGVLINRYNQALTAPSSTNGSVSYGNFTNFLKAIPSSYQVASPGANFNRYFVYNTFGFYVQDDWRANSRLTFNMGLRYEFMSTPRETFGKEYGLRNPLTDTAFTAGPVMANHTFYNFSPRLGFAWDVQGNGRTSVRGGVGVYYDVGNLGNDFTRDALGHPPFASTNTISNLVTNAVIPFPLVQSGGTAISSILYNAAQPNVLQYNLTIERQLPGNMSLGVAYVGSRGAHIWQTQQGNPVSMPYDQTVTVNGTPTRFYTALVNGVEYWSNTIPNCIAVIPSCRVNPNFGSNVQNTPVGISHFNSLQVNLNKRLSRGMEFQVAYTWAHALDTTQGTLNSVCNASGQDVGTDPNFPRTDYGPSCYDIRHNLRLNLLYHFPHMKSDSFLTKFTNGWWMGNIVSIQTGYPFTPTTSVNRSNNSIVSGGGADRVNFNTAASITASGFPGSCTSLPGQPKAGANPCQYTPIPYDPNTVITGNPAQWFNPAMFSLQPQVQCPGVPAAPVFLCGSLGNTSRGFLRGPGLGTWDFSIVKDTAARFLGEAGSVQFRAEFFNILNRANFLTPSGVTFTGTPTDVGPYSEPLVSTAGQISITSTTSRQVQLALKLVF